MRDRFSEIQSFLKIVEAGSLSEGARRLGLSLAATSRRLTQLETRLGVPLIRRNSRHLTLTDEGAIFFDKAGRALAELDDAEAAVMRTATDASGLLRVVTTIAFGRRRLAPLLHHYAMLHPEVEVHLETAEQAGNIVESGHDIAICFDPQPDSTLIMKRLADNPRVLCASPTYLHRRGRPQHATDLADHDMIVVGSGAQDLWRGIDMGGAAPKRMLSTNDGELARLWAIDGAGVVIKSLWDVSEDLTAGRLETLLPAVSLPASRIAALYLPAQGDTAKVRSCLGFLAKHLGVDSANGRALHAD
ncbi:LysR family transcriptional regulator [Sphingomonas naphthae]|uniref:LysR family transcriptional regulator n=1 Tax=Sphingomonas naphthae TaxID=1813468 RepID=A0ABY7TNU7_9SPHN|nr:LysR family transcriptional regulator [Sphingomonas naphthae]WCT74911.1 LysR family transcriptional regulator [Sphingomonas naphthae]